MADEEAGWVDPNDWKTAPKDDSGWVDPKDWAVAQPKSSVAKMASSLEGTAAGPPAAEQSVWEDIGKTLGISPVKGPIHALGTPGDVKSLIETGMEKVGVPKERREGALKGIAATPLGFMARGPTSAQVQKGVEQATGPLYEPKTDWGKRVGTLANAATNPLSYVGPGSMAAKALLAETSAAGSEVGGWAAKDTPLETPARIVGSIVGGAGPAGVEAALRSKPRFDKFHEVADSQYTASRNLGIEFKPKSVFDLQKSIYDKLTKQGYRDHTAGSTFKLVGELTQGPNGTRGYLVDDIKGVKDALKMVPAGDPRNNADFAAAQIVRKEIDNFFKAAKPTDAVVNPGSLADFKKMYGDAAKNWGAAENLQRIDKKVAKADRQTNASDALKPYNKQRQAIESIIDNDAVKRFYTPAQQKQMDRIISGTWPGEIGRWMGKASPRSMLSFLSGATGAASGFAPHVLGMWGLGEAGRAVSGASTRRQIGILEDMIRRDAPAYSNQLKPTPSALGPQSRTPFPYIDELSGLTGGEPAPSSRPEPKPKSAPKTIPIEDQKEIRKALDIARQLQGVSRQSGGRVGGGRYTEEELDASRQEDRRFRQFLGRVAPRGIPWQKYRRTSPSNIEDRSNERYVSEEEHDRRTTPVPNWAPISDLSRQAGYDDIKKKHGGAVEPTEAQKKAGNYKKHHASIHGLDVTIENLRGTVRSGKDRNGKSWSVTMPSHYGYFKRSEGADGDHVDCYIGPAPKSRIVTVIDQKDANTGKFDEHKCMLGFASKDQAVSSYKRGFSDGKGAQRVGSATEMDVDEFKDWLKNGDTTKKLDAFKSGGKVKRRIPPHVTIPEPPATLKKQQQSLISGRRKAMLYPHRSTELALPRGMRRMKTKDGLIHFNPKLLKPSQIRDASGKGKINEILEMGPVTKEEALARAAKGEKLVAVTERGPDGVEAKSALGTEQTAPAQLAALQETADPGDWVAVEPVQETLARRAVA